MTLEHSRRHRAEQSFSSRENDGCSNWDGSPNDGPGSVSTPASTETVLDWNQIALDAIRHYSIAHAPEDPPFAARALAMESIAVLDVLQAIGDRPGFLVDLEAPDVISSDAAISAAAHEILVELFPDYRPQLDRAYEHRLAEIRDGLAEDQGVAFGTEVADAVIAARSQDGADGWASTGMVEGTEPGEYRPTEPDFGPALQPDWGDVTPFTLLDGDQFRPAGPPDLTSEAYADAFDEVHELGGVDSDARTPEQTEIALWWSNDEFTYTRVGQWNDIADDLLASQGRSPEESALLLAELNAGIADTLIAGWDAKYAYTSWRPVTAIQEAGSDGNPATVPDPEWTSLLPSPGHPDYVSGHSVIGATAARVMTEFFGAIPFSGTSEALPDVIRQFENFEQAAQEEADSRIYGGVHFRFATEDGLALGEQVGDWTVATFQERLSVASDNGVLA